MTIEKEIPMVVDWLRGMAEAAGCRGLVVGLSGGVDSSTAAALMKKAFPDNCLGIILPIHSNTQDQTDALAVAKTFEIPHYILDVENEHRSILERSLTSMQNMGCEPHVRMTDANLRARLRMSCIYAAANALEYMVIGTDNAAELYLGYFTKFGDGGCDIMPLAAFTKGEVRELGSLLGVPQTIIEKPPSAGLWEGQTDEGELGISYEVIDAYLQGQSVKDEQRALIEKHHKQSAHKRETPAYYKRQP